MKCTKCENRPNMVKKTDGHDNWWQCPQCRSTIGKKKEEDEQSTSTQDK